MKPTKKPNRLINEKSPYLLQHAHNPVDWYPWSEEAFAKAKAEDKPLFLSIGYSTCHWCHVMERESFEDDEVAAVLNRVFVCLKVDREERPDIDNIYMTVCQAMTGSGGWPLTILMRHDKRPFFAGTYFPKDSRHGRIGVMALAERVEKIWLTARDELSKTADSVMASLQPAANVTPGETSGEDVLHLAYEQLAKRFDPVYGGFGQSPKFPTPHNLTFLLRYWQRTGKAGALEMVEKTLTQMYQGGIFDHLGFGFHRYATDREWLLPHFEKMLYDQALLSIAYVEAYQATGQSSFANAAREVFAYVWRDMTAPEGGFYSAEDADSEGEEGRCYVWTSDEIQAILGEKDAAIFCQVFNVRQEGNFLDEATRQPTEKNILHMTRALPELAETLGLEEKHLTEKLAEMKEKLFLARCQRVPPYKDDKVLTDWNGLMIAALAIGGRVLADENLTTTAQRAAGFILTQLKKEGRLLKRYRQGQAALPAHLDDYAFLVWGLLELYETTFAPDWLREALTLNQIQLEHFLDTESGSFFFTADDTEEILGRQREFYDGAMPSGNAISAMNNLRLARLTGNAALEETALNITRACGSNLRQFPSAYTQMLSAVDFSISSSLEVVLVGDPAAADTKALIRGLRSRFIPHMVVLLRQAGEQGQELAKLAPFTEAMQPIDGKATAYVCRDHSCQVPVTDAAQLLALLRA